MKLGETLRVRRLSPGALALASSCCALHVDNNSIHGLSFKLTKFCWSITILFVAVTIKPKHQKPSDTLGVRTLPHASKNVAVDAKFLQKAATDHADLLATVSWLLMLSSFCIRWNTQHVQMFP